MSQINQNQKNEKINSKTKTNMKRKTFFKSLGTGVFSYIALKTFPFNLFNSSEIVKQGKVQVKINPSAVVRNKIGDKKN